jgi:polyferredoxin
MLAAAFAIGIVLVYYWIDPAATWKAALNPAGDPSVAFALYGLAFLAAVNLFFIRRKFCAGVCPYGAYMGLVADNNTLTVRYIDERGSDCIQCGKCVAVCPMGIDIKAGSGQLACIACGECVDACNDVLGKRSIAGLIEYRYGTAIEREPSRLTRLQAIGLWDVKRVALIAALGILIAVPALTYIGRPPLTVTIQNNGAIERVSGEVLNSYSFTLDNGETAPVSYNISVDGDSSVGVLSPAMPIWVDAHSSVTESITLAAPQSKVRPGSHTLLKIAIRSPRHSVTKDLIFYCPGAGG